MWNCSFLKSSSPALGTIRGLIVTVKLKLGTVWTESVIENTIVSE